MQTKEAIEVLSRLKDEEELHGEDKFIEWRGKVAAILKATFGSNSDQYRNFILVSEPRREGYTTARGPSRDWELYRLDAATRGKAVIRAAIFVLETFHQESPLDEASIDPELWTHVQGLIANDDWAKVPAAVAIFVEHKVRIWAGDPRKSGGEALVGKALYTKALNINGLLRMGRQTSEHEGWMSLAIGLAQAIGNVDRHHIQQRPDVRRYAMGVLGLGSLLLTQLRYEHAAQIMEAETPPEG